MHFPRLPLTWHIASPDDLPTNSGLRASAILPLTPPPNDTDASFLASNGSSKSHIVRKYERVVPKLTRIPWAEATFHTRLSFSSNTRMRPLIGLPVALEVAWHFPSRSASPRNEKDSWPEEAVMKLIDSNAVASERTMKPGWPSM